MPRDTETASALDTRPRYGTRAGWTGWVLICAGLVIVVVRPTVWVPLAVALGVGVVWSFWQIPIPTGDDLVLAVLRRSKRRKMAIAVLLTMAGILFGMVMLPAGSDAWPYYFLFGPVALMCLVGGVTFSRMVWRWPSSRRRLLDAMEHDPESVTTLDLSWDDSGPWGPGTGVRRLGWIRVVYRDGDSITLNGSPFENLHLLDLLRERFPRAGVINPELEIPLA